MWHVAEPEPILVWDGTKYSPAASLKDSHGNMVNIIVHDGCYVPLVAGGDGKWRPTAWIFTELHAVLTHLVPPNRVRGKAEEE